LGILINESTFHRAEKKTKKSLPISHHPISILNTAQKALLHLNLQTESTRNRKEEEEA